MTQRSRLAAALALGVLLAALAAVSGPFLNAPALARWTIQTQDENPVRAALAIIAIRHLPMFLLAVAAGNIIFRVLRNTSPAVTAAAAAPWLLYVLVTGSMDAVAAGEEALSWVTYQPAYFIWPHFVALPVGLLAARRMVQQAEHIG